MLPGHTGPAVDLDALLLLLVNEHQAGEQAGGIVDCLQTGGCVCAFVDLRERERERVDVRVVEGRALGGSLWTSSTGGQPSC